MKDFSFKKVFDSRGRRVRGLWSRASAYYAQMRVGDDHKVIKVRLPSATTVPQALEAMQAIKKLRRDGEFSVSHRDTSPGFCDCANRYLEQIKTLGVKRRLTIKRESSSVSALNAFFGDRKIASITERDVMAYAEHRRASVSGRAVDVDIVALRNVFKKAQRDGFVKGCPLGKWEQLSDGPAKVRLVSRDEIDAMKLAATAIDRGQLFADYLELLACSGGREQETLRMRWSVNVNWERGMIGFGQDGTGKFGKSRWLPMNPQLEAVLKAMRLRCGDSDWLFPSRYSPDRCVTTYQKDLSVVMKAAGVTEFGFHHMRHYFISRAVMSGVDFRTIADWVGHADGGVLIGKVYSHLSAEHSALQAAKLSL